MRSVKSDSNYNKQKISNKEKGGYPLWTAAFLTYY